MLQPTIEEANLEMKPKRNIANPKANIYKTISKPLIANHKVGGKVQAIYSHSQPQKLRIKGIFRNTISSILVIWYAPPTLLLYFW